MTTSTPPAWNWLHECEAPELSIHSHKVPDSDALGERNDSSDALDAIESIHEANREGTISLSELRRELAADPTGEDIWPLERDQCPDCRCAPNMPHAPGCDGVRFGCETPNKLPVGARNEHGWVVHQHPECGTVTDIDYGDLNQVTEAGLSNPLSAHMWETFNQCLAVSRRKNEDYAKDSDPLANFRACREFGVTLPQGIMVRLSDKISRIGNLLDGRDPAVRDERLEDTIQDAINYLAILLYSMETA